MPIFELKVFPEIFGDMTDRVIATTPLTDINFGSVWSTMLEAAAQEDDEQYFQMLEIIRAFSIDTTTGSELDDRAFEYGLERRQASAASTQVTLGDSAITKVSTGVYSGKAGPAGGTFAINGDSATNFPTSGSIVIGRGTPNVETVPYSSITTFANYVTFNLSGALGFDHGTDETIVLSQGGDRVFTVGTVVIVPASDLNPRVEFTLDSGATIFDGESEETDVLVTATDPGSDANVPIGSIIQYDSPPFSTATVTNPSRVTNGLDIESDQALRDRIKDTIQSLSRGTGRSIITSVLGVSTGNKRVVSASLIEPTVPADVVKLFIDDGTGFIPTFESVGFEEVVLAATGGEQFLFVDNVPMVKAFSETQDDEPYALFGGETLIVEVGDEVETVIFEGTDFAAPGAALAQEVLTKINSTATLYEARVSSGGSKVRIFSRKNVEEEIVVTGGTANSALNFSTDKKFTSKLYRERDFGIALLTKDGRTAAIESGSTAAFDMSSFDRSLLMVIDGKIKNPVAAFFTPTDFSSPASVTSKEICDLINAQVPGIVCSESSNDTKFTMFSNIERSVLSKIRVVGTFSQVWNEEASVLTDRTVEASGAGTISAFASDLDYLYLGHTDVQFNTVFGDFATPASTDVFAFEYWDGSAWTPFGVLDGTAGLTQNGIITLPRLPNWTKVAVNGSDPRYWIRIQRNGALGTPPVITDIIISNANSVFNFSEVEIVGATKDYTLNRFIGQIELAEPLAAGDRLTLGSVDTRAFVVTGSQSPYGLSGGELFEVEVDGTLQSYTFLAGDFFTPGSALASEVQIALQREIPGITVSLVDSNLRVKISTNKVSGGSIKVNATAANTVLQFPTDQIDNLISHQPAVESGSAEPYSFSVDDELIVILDNNLANNFTLPLYYENALTGVTSSSIVIDTGLSAIFPLAEDLVGYEIEMTTGTQAGVRRTILTYTPGSGTLTFAAMPGAPSIGDEYQILPADADQVARLWNNKLITTVTTDAEIRTSSSGTKVQIASLDTGEDASVQVSGGTGNAVLSFPVGKVIGVDGYRYFTNLAQLTQWTVDGRPDDEENYPGFRAAGVQVEVIEPIKVPVEVEVDVTPQEGITLISIANEIKSAVSTVINNLAVGADVLASEVLCAVKDVSGVFDVRLVRLDPRPLGSENIPIADSELARIDEEDIVVG